MKVFPNAVFLLATCSTCFAIGNVFKGAQDDASITRTLANSSSSMSNKTRPNILVIFADDVGTGDVPGYWNTNIVDMPNLESLVAEGTRFMDVHSTPLCAPSRYVFLSGNYQHRGVAYPGLWNLNYKTSQFRPGQMSIAKVLQESGYHTGMFGKWHIGGKVPTKSWYKPKKFYADKRTLLRLNKHDWSKPLEEGPWDIGFDSSYITTSGIQNPPYAFYRDDLLEPDVDDVIFWKEGNYSMPFGQSNIKREGEGSPEWDSTAFNMILVNETEAFLDDHLAMRAEDPFFAYVALGSVHIPHSPPDEYIDGTKVAGENPNKHLDMLFEMDKAVGSLVKALDARNMTNETIIVFTSDNGGLGTRHANSSEYGHLSNGPLRGIKGEIYEGGHRIPLMIRWDNGSIPKGESRSKLVGLNDVYATLCDLAEVDIPIHQAIDSVSFADNIYDENAQTRETLGVWTYAGKSMDYESIRKDEMKLIRAYKTGESFLYNLTSDVSESIDVSDGNEDLIDEMVTSLKKFGPCYDKKGKFTALVKPNGEEVIRNCQWYAKRNTNNRCRMFHLGQIHCRYTCALKNIKYC